MKPFSRRPQIESSKPTRNQAPHPAASIGGTCIAMSSRSLIIMLGHPRELVLAAERILAQQGLEDRRAHGLSGHRGAQRLVDVDALILVEDQDDDDAALVRRFVGTGLDVMAD